MSPRKTSTWNRSSTAWRCRRACVERAVHGVDDVHEQVIDHGRSRLSGPAAPRPASTIVSVVRGTPGSNVVCSRSPTRAARGSGRPPPSSRCVSAVAAGAPALELDVHGTRDGHVVVCHDPTVDRTTNGTGAIADLTLAEVKTLDSAYWFIPGADVTADRPPGDYPYRGRPPTTPSSRSPRWPRCSRPSPMSS